MKRSSPAAAGGAAASAEESARKSRRPRSSPARYIARPSRQGLGVEEGDTLFLSSPVLHPASTDPAVRQSKRLRERGNDVGDGAGEQVGKEEEPQRSRRSMPARDAKRAGLSMSMTGPKLAQSGSAKKASSAKKPPTKRKKQPVGSGAPRPPRTIVIGAGISGLACARELSERRHDVLVLEARNRIGGRLRTVDLMLDKEWTDDKETRSDLFKVKKWSPVDVGGQFIHGTGFDTTAEAFSSHVGSHDFGTSRARKRSFDDTTKKQGENKEAPPARKSERRHTVVQSAPYKGMEDKADGKKTPNVRRSADGIGSVNPVYVLARQKMRLPLHAADGSYTCLVDHNGHLISEEVDQQVAEEFNEVLDLATKCCEQGRYEWKEETVESVPSAGERKQEAATTRSKGLVTGDASRSPNYVSDDTATIHNNTENGGAMIEPGTDFGTIFEECRKYHDSLKGGSNERPTRTEDQEVRKNLFQWHVANLEMSSGAPMAELGQRWNDDEPFGYGGDHSYIEGGTRDIIEALAEGFDCRGVGDRSLLSTCDGRKKEVEKLRRSGDFTSNFTKPPSLASDNVDASSGWAMKRGVIQCGIEVTGVKVVEKEEVKLLRKQKKPQRPVKQEPPSMRRSNRENKGTKLPSFLEALSTSRSKGEGMDETHPLTTDETLPASTSVYGNEHNSVVQVTTKCGLTLEADAVVVTLPLALLGAPLGSPGHISFSPSLPIEKRNAINRLGVGAYNKCCMSFTKPFWNNLPRLVSTPGNWNDTATQRFDFIGHASADHGKDILFFSLRNAPILVAIYGGSNYSKQIEGMHDEDVVHECMSVLKKVCTNAIKGRGDTLKTRQQVDMDVPDWPIDYFVSRWGSDPYSRGAFCYVPPGVNGIDELKAMSQPMHDYRPEWMEESDDKPKRPLIMFAGEATTPYHPSTIHGAFETGIREAYRLDLALEPTLNPGVTFDESYLYQPTFSVRRGQTDPNPTLGKAPEQKSERNETDNGEKTTDWWFDHDASILRGVESFGLSAKTMRKIKSKVLTPAGDIHGVKAMEDRYKSLMTMLSPADDAEHTYNAEKEWKLPGRRGTWLAPGVAQKTKGKPKEEAKLDRMDSNATDDSSTRRSSRRAQRKVDDDYAFY